MTPRPHPRICRCLACRVRRRAACRAVIHAAVRCPTCGAAARTLAALLLHAAYCEERLRTTIAAKLNAVIASVPLARRPLVGALPIAGGEPAHRHRSAPPCPPGMPGDGEESHFEGSHTSR